MSPLKSTVHKAKTKRFNKKYTVCGKFGSRGPNKNLDNKIKKKQAASLENIIIFVWIKLKIRKNRVLGGE